MSLATRLRDARMKKGWSQRELGRQADVRYPTISELESGARKTMNTDTAKRLARALGISVDYLIGTFEPDEEEDEPATAVA